MMKKFNKYNSFVQRLLYTKIYRAPKWIYRKLVNQKINRDQDYLVPMRIGHKIKIRPTQRYLENVIYSGQYNDENVFWIKPLMEDGSVIMDIGANVGLYTCAYAEYFKKLKIQIYAIEAVANNFKNLKENIEINNFSNIKIDQIALGKEEGELVFDLPYEGFIGNAVGGNIFTSNETKKFQTKVKMITLDKYAVENKIERCDFLKIDVEGAEYFVFQGAAKFLEKCRPVVQSEFNAHWLKQANVNFQDFVKLFLSLNYLCAIEKGNTIEVINNPEQFVLQDQLVDLIFIPQEKLDLLN